MKINGELISGPNIVLVVIPRPDKKVRVKEVIEGKEIEIEKIVSGSIPFKAKAILDYSPFEKMCPKPEAPIMLLPGGIQKRNVEDAGFKNKLERYGILRYAWIILTSLAATPGLTWDKVKPGEAETWPLYEEELKESGFSTIEIGRITNAVLEANCLDEEKVEAARQSFLASAGVAPAL